ncbi:MAG TPA: hypothetical protein PLQ00_04700, partial [Thermoguttaceae bacterium]|nr:hypothetical protein [Thermoguttaceae bacterium]
MSTKGLRNFAIVAFVVSMALLLGGGFFAFDKVPPIPDKVVVQPNGSESALAGQGGETSAASSGG